MKDPSLKAETTLQRRRCLTFCIPIRYRSKHSFPPRGVFLPILRFRQARAAGSGLARPSFPSPLILSIHSACWQPLNIPPCDRHTFRMFSKKTTRNGVPPPTLLLLIAQAFSFSSLLSFLRGWSRQPAFTISIVLWLSSVPRGFLFLPTSFLLFWSQAVSCRPALSQ